MRSAINFSSSRCNKFLAIVSLLLLSACAKAPGRKPVHVELTQVSYAKLEGWTQDHHLQSLRALRISCRAIVKRDHHKHISKSTSLGGRVGDWVPICRAAFNEEIFFSKQARTFFETWFTPYKARDMEGSSDGKFTGYYEIEMPGSLKKSKLFQYPVYRNPTKSSKLKGKLSHAAINNGALANKGLEIAWVADRARLFFMQIQGSGIIKLNTGGELKLGYAGQNGFAYTAIGPFFKKYTKTPIRSARDMMTWLHRNPSIGKKIMELNQSYVFFRITNGSSPIGAQGVHLTPERSMAVDYRLYPYGTPIWLETHLPKTSSHHRRPYRLLMIAQDTGGAIRGAIRGDVFFGRGNYAEEMASYMNQTGNYFILFPKTVTVPKIYHSKRK